ncbi:MAG TPA: hypothetical protein VGT40_24390 [Methylomirabilota bacterium]|jgi:hypothetical protein|nr:hypothetical protein [Methylomirabilota bacterium]
MTSPDYWYVRARNTETGAEIQRIALARADEFGASNAAGASEDMRAYLVRIGLAMDGDLANWKIVEVHRVGAARLSR